MIQGLGSMRELLWLPENMGQAIDLPASRWTSVSLSLAGTPPGLTTGGPDLDMKHRR